MNTEKLTAFCLNLPSAAEEVKWEDHLCFVVGGKIFCTTGFNDDAGVSMKVTPENFEILTERDGIIPAPYMAHNKWIQVQKRSALKPKEWEHYIKDSYQLVISKLPKKLQLSIAESKKITTKTKRLQNKAKKK